MYLELHSVWKATRTCDSRLYCIQQWPVNTGGSRFFRVFLHGCAFIVFLLRWRTSGQLHSYVQIPVLSQGPAYLSVHLLMMDVRAWNYVNGNGNGNVKQVDLSEPSVPRVVAHLSWQPCVSVFVTGFHEKQQIKITKNINLLQKNRHIQRDELHVKVFIVHNIQNTDSFIN